MRHLILVFALFSQLVMAQNVDLIPFPLLVEGQLFMSFGTATQKDKPLLILVHGSPGDHSAWKKYMIDKELQQKFNIIALDRPGFGTSDSTKAYPDLQFQAKVVHQIIVQYANHQPVILMGHSVGGPIVMRCALDYPLYIKQVILLAPAISAQHEQPRWYNKLAQKAWLQKRLPLAMRTSQSEMMALPSDLQKMEALYPKLKAEIWCLHGRWDMIAPFGNALFLQRVLSATKFNLTVFKRENHFIPWTKFDEVKQLLLHLN